ncbi:MAG: metallophosphoesterase, partial [candidate division KSB1 bacterium]|nr:metallophosphoesterase [candidate division KSB1 bacterium]
MRNMTIGLLLLITLLGCGTSKVYPPAAPHTDAITILHVNDMHGAFLPVTIKDRDGNRERKLGGVLALNHYIKTIRNENHPTLLLNAGDFMTGSPICDIEYEGAFGGALVKFFNDIGFDGLTPGNHEFDISVDNAQKLFDLCNFPVFSANLYHADGRLFTKEPYQIYSKGNLAVGVIGTIVDDLPNYLNRPQRDQLVARPSAPIVDSLAKILDPLTDLIVVLSHNGLQADSLLAVTVGPEVDVIIGGHSHHLLQKPAIVNRKIIVQAGSRWRDLGRLDLVVAADTVFSYNYQVIPLWNEGIESEPSLEAEVKKEGVYTEASAKTFLRQMLPVLKYIHSQKVIHRDIKPGNILREKKTNKLYLIDFGAVKEQVNTQLMNQNPESAFTKISVGTMGFA